MRFGCAKSRGESVTFIFAVKTGMRNGKEAELEQNRRKWKGEEEMPDNGSETRIALIGIIVEEVDATEQINNLLHEYREYIVGRMGIPYRGKEVSIISVVLDAPEKVISALSGKIGMIRGISVKTMQTKR